MVRKHVAAETTSLTRSPLLTPVELHRAPVQLLPTRRIDLVAQFSGAFDLAEGQPMGHAASVAHIALAFGRELRLDAAGRRRLLYAALLHDAGVAIRVLPPGVEAAGGHTAAGAWLASLIGLDAETQRVIRCTHERWDGDGRPGRLVMSDIPIESLVISAAHWVTDLVTPLDNPLRVRAALRTFQVRDLEPLVGLRVARAALAQLHRDEVWMSLWDEQLAARVALQAPDDGQPATAHVEHIAAAIGVVVDAAVREPGRAERVAELAVELGRQAGLAATLGPALRVAALVMDIGQLGVPRHVTEKLAILSIDEMELMRRHPGWAARLLETLPGFEELALWVESHHERPDGRGYPESLTQTEIPLPARILAVADSYWALRAPRAYRPALDDEDATRVIEQAAVTQFDPGVASVLRRALRAIEARAAVAAA